MTNEKQEPAKGVRIGQVFQHSYKRTLYSLTVVETDDGSLGYLMGDCIYKSPTAAAKAIVGDKSVNGRSFWHID